jgi:hypothetical protein
MFDHALVDSPVRNPAAMAIIPIAISSIMMLLNVLLI